jgi:4-hydroxythreonine-4-phosphate dehydrogenase
MAARALGIVADDLSGAAECASHALLRVSRSMVVLAGLSAAGEAVAVTTSSDAAVVTVDTDSRRLPTDEAVRAVRVAAALVSDTPVVVKKVDSLLRGHVAAEVAALAQVLRRTPVVAVANPALDRVVRDGVLHVGGTPLHDSDLWGVEPNAAPTRVAEALHPMPTVLVPHAVIALGIDAVADALAAAADSGVVAVCDAVTDTDLEVVHAAATRSGSPSLLVGSGALVAVAVRALPDLTPAEPPERQSRPGGVGAARSMLMVLGTRAPGVPAQIAQVGSLASETVLLQPDELLADPSGTAARLSGLPTDGTVVVALDPAAPADPSRSRALTGALVDAVTPLLEGYDAAFLAGGETARAVLDRLGVHSLEIVDEIETGTVVSRRPGGRTVVTRPGSFGDADSLVRVITHLLTGTRRTAQNHPAATTNAPSATTNAPSATTEENP